MVALYSQFRSSSQQSSFSPWSITEVHLRVPYKDSCSLPDDRIQVFASFSSSFLKRSKEAEPGNHLSSSSLIFRRLVVLTTNPRRFLWFSSVSKSLSAACHRKLPVTRKLPVHTFPAPKGSGFLCRRFSEGDDETTILLSSLMTF